jgi:hypothetical protein
MPFCEPLTIGPRSKLLVHLNSPSGNSRVVVEAVVLVVEVVVVVVVVDVVDGSTVVRKSVIICKLFPLVSVVLGTPTAFDPLIKYGPAKTPAAKLAATATVMTTAPRIQEDAPAASAGAAAGAEAIEAAGVGEAAVATAAVLGPAVLGAAVLRAGGTNDPELDAGVELAAAVPPFPLLSRLGLGSNG